MDTNETLNRLRQLLDSGYGSRLLLGDEGFIAALTECAQDLDDGLSRGFFLPEGWRHPRLDEWTRELAITAITHKYALDDEGVTQLRDDQRGELERALLAALKGDWTKVEGHTVHVRAGAQLRAYARQEGFTLPSMADRVTLEPGSCGQRWVAEIQLCPRCGLSAAEHPNS